MLTQHLRELEKDNLVSRQIFNEVPAKVEYSLTEIGEKFIPVMTMMEDWGKYYITQTGIETF